MFSGAVIGIWFIAQLHYIEKHDPINSHSKHANTSAFLDHWDLLTIGRTANHEKTVEYWFDWLHEKFHGFNKTITILHFDSHGEEDNDKNLIYTCSAAQLLYWEYFIDETLQSARSIYLSGFEQGLNATRHALRHGNVP